MYQIVIVNFSAKVTITLLPWSDYSLLKLNRILYAASWFCENGTVNMSGVKTENYHTGCTIMDIRNTNYKIIH